MLSYSVIVLLVLFVTSGSCFNISFQVGPEHQIQPRFATPCTTPNFDSGVCIEIQKCSIFKDSLKSGRTDNHDFIRESRCGPVNEDPNQPKVCCGNRDNYRDGPIPPTTIRPVKPSEKDNNPLPKQCGKQTIVTPSRIYGGRIASVGEFPWMARLLHRSRNGLVRYGCAGFLIAEQFVLTAAHCVLSKDLQPLGPIFKVQLGEHDTRTNPDCEGSPQNRRCADSPQLIKVAKPITHPKYKDTIQQHNDIALIPLKKPAKFTDFVYPICLAKDETEETEMWLSGWGKTETHESSHVKLKVSIFRASTQRCAEIYRTLGVVILDTQLCAGGEEGLDSCSGDSGGPIMVQTGTGPWRAEGIVSFGLGCGLEGWPGIYTNIPKYLPWIKKKMNHYLRKQRQQRNATMLDVKH